MICKKAQRLLKFFFALVLLCIAPDYAQAEIIDDISLKTDANGEVDAVIKFTVPIQRLRYFPQRKSPYLVVYFNILDNVPRDQWQDYESHKSPPSDLIVGFTVSTRDVNTGPKIEIQFNRPVEFSLKAGRDSQSLLVHIKPDKPQQDKDGKAAPVQPGGIITSAATTAATAVTAALAATAAIANLATPKAGLPSLAVATTSPSSTVPAQAPITSDAAAKPAETTTPPLPSAAQAQIGGKDGLPVFPKIEQTAIAPGKAQPATEPSLPEDLSRVEILPLSEQIKIANAQAAAMMSKGRDAFLSGDTYAAIDAFNNTLKLPPNKYSPDAQIWIGIAREKAGQLAKATMEYETYLKLYPSGGEVTWVKGRLAKLKAFTPSAAMLQAAPVKAQSTEFQTTEYGSLSMYSYTGASQTDTVMTVGAVQTPTKLSFTDQSALISSVSMTARSYNNEFDNRLVFQDFYAANFLPNQQNRHRLNAAYYEVKNRIDNYSARVGRQSAYGGGVLGRFDGATAGYGFTPNTRTNIVAGQLSDIVLGPKPLFVGGSFDFGVKDALGGSVYVIRQTVGGITDRKAVGGNARYFDQGKSAITMLDYDIQFKELNMVTLQGTLNGASGTDYNLLLDRRKAPMLAIRSAVNGTTATVDTLLNNGWITSDLIALAKLRTAISNVAMVGRNDRLNEKWQVGTDFMISNTTGMPQSGTLVGGATGLEGFVPASPASGNAWTLSERVIGNDVFSSHDVSMLSLSYTKSHFMTGEMLMLNSHSSLQNQLTLDSTLRLYWQADNFGGKQNTIAPLLRFGYRVRNSLTLETEGGLELTRSTPSTLAASKTTRQYFSFGFRWDF